MRLSLTARMFGALFGMSAVMVALVVVWADWALDARFSSYVGAAMLAGMDPVAEALEQDYAAHAGWSGVAGKPDAWDSVLRAAEPGPGRGWMHDRPPGFGPEPPPGVAPPGAPPGPPPGGMPPDGEMRRWHGRLGLVDGAGRAVAGALPQSGHAARRVLWVAGRPVGALVFEADPLPGSIERAFLAERYRDLYAAAGVALVLSLLVASLLARSILAPVRLVTAGAQRLASGAYATRIETGRGDELGALVRDFNLLAASLEQAEASRRSWMADTSHELRTPLAVMQAQIEALQDGIHLAGPAALGRLHDEVLRMARLVGDLHELARADSQALALRLEPVRPGAILRDVLEGFAARLEVAGLQLMADGLGAEAEVMGDPGRLRQVFDNLVENAVRYSDAGGRIEVGEIVAAGFVRIRLEDTAPGVGEAKLPHLFERFFRVETSRNRRTGGSGLGLAICRAIVEAHGGRIEAAASPLGGLAVTVMLPCGART